MSVRARSSISLLSTVEIYNHLAANYITAQNIEAQYIKTDQLVAKLIQADIIQATQIEGQYVISDSIMTNYLTAEQIQTDYLTATQIAGAYASISQLNAIGIDVSNLNATVITTDILNSAVSNLGYVTAATVEAGYADIDLANVELISGEAFITEDLVTGNAYINAAYIKNLTADSLRLRGKDGLYYAINVDQGEVSADETDQDVIDEYGSFISGEAMLDRTITASKIYVDDLYAIKGQFGTARIGGLELESGSIHSANVTSVNDTDKGFYLNSAGEMALIGHNSALKFFIDASDNNRRKLSITADEIFIGSTNVATSVSHAESAYSNGIKSTVQLWYTKANTTAPSKPSSVVTSTSTSGNAWRVVVPTYNASYPYYYYCFQYQYNDGTYGWSDVVRDRATEEAQSQARTAAGDLANYITSNDAALTNLQSQLDGQIEAWYIDGAPNTTETPNQNDPALDWTTLDLKKRHLGDLYYDINTGHSWRYLATNQEVASTYSWSQIPDSDAAAALAAAQAAQTLANSKRRIFVSQPTVPYNIGDVWIDTVNGSKVIKYATVDRTTGSYTASDWSLAATAITDIVREYATNQSPTTAPTTGWGTGVPTWQDGWYIWERVTTYTNGTSSVGTPVCISGAKGETGEAGNGIASVTAYYATTTVQVAPSASSITSTTIPAMSATNKYLWKKEVVTYTDTSVPSTTSIILIAVYGDSGSRGNGYIYVVSTQSANASAWTGSTTELESITTGTQILFNLRVAPSSSNTTLNLTLSGGTTTGAKNVYYSGTTRLNNQYPINSMIPLVYDGTSWYVASPYTNTNTYDRVLHASAVTCNPTSTGIGIYVGDYSGYHKLSAGTTFDINYPPLYMSDSTTGLSTTTAMYEVYPDVSLTSNKSGISLTSKSMAYIVGTLAGNTFTVDSAVFAMAPTLPDDKLYIPVGLLSSTNTIYFQSSKEIYKFDSLRGFGLIQNAAIVAKKTEYALSKTENNVKVITDISYAFIAASDNSEPAAGSSYWVSTLDDGNWYEIPEMTGYYKNLWRKETITYSDNTTEVDITKIFIYDSQTQQAPAKIAFRYVWTATDDVPEMNNISYVTVRPLVEPYTHLWQKEVIDYTDTTTFPRERYARQIYVDWQDTVPTSTRDGYLWTREKVTYAVGDPEYTSPVCITQYTRYIVEPNLEEVKEYSFRQSAGLVADGVSAGLESIKSVYVKATDYESHRADYESRLTLAEGNISAKVSKTYVDNLVDEVTGELAEYKREVARYLDFTLEDGLVISSSETAVQSVFTESAWEIRSGGTALQKVDAEDGAQFSTISIKDINGSNTNGKLVLGNLTIEVQSDLTVIGRKS